MQEAQGADLYHNHAKRIDVCLSCDPVAVHDNLWRGPPRAISLNLGYENGIQPTNNGGKAKIRQTSAATVVDENVGLEKVVDTDERGRGEAPAPFKSPCVACFA